MELSKNLEKYCAGVAILSGADTEDDQTCLEDFQECIEEYQECLEVVHICIDEENSFNHSPCTSQVEELGQKFNSAQKTTTNDFLENNYLNVNKNKPRDSIGDSDLDISFKSTNETHLDNKPPSDCENSNVHNSVSTKNNNHKLNKNDSLTTHSDRSDRISSEKDGYETCIDESLSEDNKKIIETEATTKTDNHDDDDEVQKQHVESEDITPTNSRNVLDQMNIDVPDSATESTKTGSTTTVATIVNVAVSEPCLSTNFTEHHISLDNKFDDDLKSYDHQDNSGADEFFLVQYPPDTSKSLSEPNVLDVPRKNCYKRCLKEYYNDYEDCLEAYKIQEEARRVEMADEEIFNEIVLPFKSRSAPDIMDRSFVMLTYDPGPDRNRRKSAFLPGYQLEDVDKFPQMTVVRQIDNDYGQLKGCHVDDMLQKHWGSTHTVKVFREPNKSLGISIVGGKVDLQKTDSNAVLGIFVKTVVPDSPAGKTGLFKTGDRILEVSGVDLRQASHETAVEAIRNASNPVSFVVQSLIPWNIEIDNSAIENEENCPSPFPSPVSVKAPVEINVESRAVLDSKSSENDEPSTSEQPPSTAEAVSDVDLPVSVRAENDDDVVAIRDESLEASDDDEEDVREMEGRTVSAKGQQIDRASAANVKRTKEEATADPEQEDDFGYTMSK